MNSVKYEDYFDIFVMQSAFFLLSECFAKFCYCRHILHDTGLTHCGPIIPDT